MKSWAWIERAAVCFGSCHNFKMILTKPQCEENDNNFVKIGFDDWLSAGMVRTGIVGYLYHHFCHIGIK